MKYLTKLVGSAAASCLLSACGGAGTGGGGGIMPPPPPPPAPAATYPNFAALTADQQIPLGGFTLSRTDTSTATGFVNGATTVAFKPFDGGSLSISYDAAKSSYTVHEGSRSQTFKPSDIRADFGLNGPAFQNYYVENTGPTQQDYLSLYRPVGAGDDVPLTYTTLAEWTRISLSKSNDGRTTTTRTADVLSYGGFETRASDMPRTGSANYHGPLRAYHIDGLSLRSVQGRARLIADFGKATVRADLVVNVPKDSSASEMSDVSFGGTGSILSTRFSGTFETPGYNGDFNGAFFGPRGAEMGLSFDVTGPKDIRILGVAAGSQ